MAKITNNMQKLARKQYKRMKKAVPHFNKVAHYLVVIDDSSGNIFEVIGCGLTWTSAVTDVIPFALERLDRDWDDIPDMNVGLMRNGRMVSWSMKNLGR
tara:strand:- start:1255 stop:1551 length:297 start_codon:yes stop_codon:yes gene_type:complete